MVRIETGKGIYIDEEEMQPCDYCGDPGGFFLSDIQAWLCDQCETEYLHELEQEYWHSPCSCSKAQPNCGREFCRGYLT